MTSIRVDGQDPNHANGPPIQPTPMYSIPLHSTSAINVQLFHQQQQQLFQQQQQQGGLQSSASTYVRLPSRSIPAQNHPINIQTVGVNTEDTVDAPRPGIQISGSNPNFNTTTTPESVTVQQTNTPHTRTVLVSVESEQDSARGSTQDDTGSLHSSGSRGTAESLPDDQLSRRFTALNVTIPSDDGIVTSPTYTGSDQPAFSIGRGHSVMSSNGSQSSFGSPTSSAAMSPRVDKNGKKQTKWSLTWDDEEDKTSETTSPEWSNRFSDASSFILDEFTDEETRAAEDAEALKATRVAVLKGEEITAMIKVKCSTEEMGYDLRVITMLQDILVRCDQLGQKMKGVAVRLTPFHLNKMKMQDGRPAKERAAEVARTLGGDFILCEAVCQKNADRLHICTELKDIVYEKGTFSVGKLGIMITLWKKHKYAVAREFADPLCSHIHFYRPTLLGSSSDSKSKKKRKATDTVRRVMQSPALLAQMFKTDPTITVAEAARRSFVDIIFYALYE